MASLPIFLWLVWHVLSSPWALSLFGCFQFTKFFIFCVLVLCAKPEGHDRLSALQLQKMWNSSPMDTFMEYKPTNLGYSLFSWLPRKFSYSEPLFLCLHIHLETRIRKSLHPRTKKKLRLANPQPVGVLLPLPTRPTTKAANQEPVLSPSALWLHSHYELWDLHFLSLEN